MPCSALYLSSYLPPSIPVILLSSFLSPPSSSLAEILPYFAFNLSASVQLNICAVAKEEQGTGVNKGHNGNCKWVLNGNQGNESPQSPVQLCNATCYTGQLGMVLVQAKGGVAQMS